MLLTRTTPSRSRCTAALLLGAAPLPRRLTATREVVPNRGGEEFLRRLFEPLGCAVSAVPHPLAPTVPDWLRVPVFS